MPIFKFKKESRNQSRDPFVIKESNFRLENFSYRTGWTEESFVSSGGGRETVGKTFNLTRLRPIAAVFLIFFSVLTARVAWLQIAKGDYYYQMAEGNRIRVERLEARRGVIYDRNGLPLVRNQANFLLYLIPADLPKDPGETDKIINRVSEILGSIDRPETDFKASAEKNATTTLGRAEIATLIKNNLSVLKPGSIETYQPLYIIDNIAYEKAMLLSLESANWPGVVLSSRSGRFYNLAANSLSHVLGYTGKINEAELEKFGDEYSLIDYLGKTGVEYFWENELKGRMGRKQIEVDALGREKKVISREEPVDGRSLVLAIDAALQKKLEEALAVTLKKLKLAKAAAVVLDPRNGEVLALVSLPAFDNNVFARGISAEAYGKLAGDPNRPLFNRAVSGEYPSGSTIKPVMAAAALEEGVISESTTVVSSGGLSVGEWFFPDWRAGGHGPTSVRKAIADSVNTFFYYIGGGYQNFQGLGVDRIVRYEKLFGLGAQTGIDLSGEAAGFLPSKEWKEKAKGERWYIGDTYHLSIGQGDLAVTPLQVAAYTAVFANGGKLYRPHLVNKILMDNDKNPQPVENLPVRENFIDPKNIEIVREGMRQTVTAGSARSLTTVPVAVAGKTGTAQWSTKKPPHAWFTGFAPYDDPEIVITVLIEAAGEGSSYAVPIARNVLSWYFSPNRK